MREIKTLYVTARPITFPSEIRIEYRHHDEETGLAANEGGTDDPTSWDEIKRRFMIDATYAKECEAYLQNGEAVFLGKREVEFSRKVATTEPLR